VGRAALRRDMLAGRDHLATAAVAATATAANR